MVPVMSEIQEIAVIKTVQGELSVRFWDDVAPKTVENFKKLTKMPNNCEQLLKKWRTHS